MNPFPPRRYPPARKATVRFVVPPRPRPECLRARIEAAKLTALGFRRLADMATDGSRQRQTMTASAKAWEEKAEDLARLLRGKQTLTITVP